MLMGSFATGWLVSPLWAAIEALWIEHHLALADAERWTLKTWAHWGKKKQAGSMDAHAEDAAGFQTNLPSHQWHWL